MNRLEGHINALQKKEQKAFVAYIMAGEHGIEETKRQLFYLVEQGVDVIELGVPFSDPVADGPVITQAGQRALAQGIHLSDVMQMVSEVRHMIDIPIVLMTYMNPVYAYGVDAFFRDLHSSGIDGLIIPDVPFEESQPLQRRCKEEGICYISFVSLTSSTKRIEQIVKDARGFIYGITVTGITGKQTEYKEEVFELLRRVKQLTTVPLFAGFGISTPQHVKQFLEVCDGVIVGTKIIELFNQNQKEAIESLIRSKNISIRPVLEK